MNATQQTFRTRGGQLLIGRNRGASSGPAVRPLLTRPASRKRTFDMLKRRDFASGTYTESVYPWGTFVGGAALCSDGKVRRLARVSATADTFFSVPAAVRVRGKYVAGYVTVEALVATPDDPAVLKFVAYQNRKNGHLLP